MAFGGGAGVPGGMWTASNIRLPFGSGIGVYDSANRISAVAAGSSGPYIGDPAQQIKTQVKSLLLLSALGEFVGQQNVPLSGFADQTLNGSAVDTGVLVTAVPIANQHGIPTNFGPGRGLWTFADLARFSIDIFYVDPAAYSAGGGTTGVSLISVNTGNLIIVVKNQSAEALNNLCIRLHYNHSQEA